MHKQIIRNSYSHYKKFLGSAQDLLHNSFTWVFLTFLTSSMIYKYCLYSTPDSPSYIVCDIQKVRQDSAKCSQNQEAPLWGTFKQLLLPLKARVCWAQPMSYRSLQKATGFSLVSVIQRNASTSHEVLGVFAKCSCTLPPPNSDSFQNNMGK